jgi:hypothetical protein
VYREAVAAFCRLVLKIQSRMDFRVGSRGWWNALVVVPEVGRKLCRDAILQYIDATAAGRYERKLTRARNQLRRALRERVGA